MMFRILLAFHWFVLCTGDIISVPLLKSLKGTPAVLQFNSSSDVTSITCTLINDEQVVNVYIFEDDVSEAEGPLKGRALMIVTPNGFELRISEVKISDSGEYRCRSKSNIWVAVLNVEGKPEIVKESHNQHGSPAHDSHGSPAHDSHGSSTHDNHGLSEHDMHGSTGHDIHGIAMHDKNRSSGHDKQGSETNKHGLPDLTHHGLSEHNELEFEEEIHLHVNYCSNPLPVFRRWYFPKGEYFITADSKLELIIVSRKAMSRYCFQEEILLLHIQKKHSGEYTFKIGNSYGNESQSYHVEVLPEDKGFDPVLVTCLVVFITFAIVILLLIVCWFYLHRDKAGPVENMAKLKLGQYSAVKTR